MKLRAHSEFVLPLLLSISLTALAHEREWRTAIFLGFNSGQSGTATMPVGSGRATVPLSTQNYWFRTDELDYCLSFPTRLSGRVPNLTIHGTTNIAIEC